MKNRIAFLIWLVVMAGPFAWQEVYASELDPVEEGKMIPLTIEQLSKAADVIVHGTIKEITVKRDNQKRIFTSINLAVLDTWKGSTGGKEISFVHGGGTLGRAKVEISGQPTYSPNEEVVLFLVWNKRKEAIVYGMSQGKFSVITPTNGEKIARNPFHGVKSQTELTLAALGEKVRNSHRN